MRKISIMLVEDHKLLRDTWTSLLNQQLKYEVIASTGSGEEAIKLAEELKPDIILMDINIRDTSGIIATKRIHKRFPASKIIALSVYSSPVYLEKMMDAGASGYLSKNISQGELITALDEVSKGKQYICNEVKLNFINGIVEQKLETPPDLALLSKKQLQIIRYVKEGLSSKEIAERMNVTFRTIQGHRTKILKKLHLKNTVALVSFAIHYEL